MDGAARRRFFDRMVDVFHASPEAMSEGRPHNRAKTAAFDALVRHFRLIGRHIYVADELAVIYPGEPLFDPDLIAVLDVPQPDPDEDERMAWVVTEEGKGPDFILEVLHTGSRDKDLRRNVIDYARLGVREYFVYDRQKFKLHGFRLPSGGRRYQALNPLVGRLSSEVLGLDLAVIDRRLRFFSGVAELMNSEEFIARLSRMMDGIEIRAQLAEAQAAAAEAQARQGVLDLAEAFGVELTAERRELVEAAELDALEAFRLALKAHRGWPV